ncbi:LacI family DNA-binding transcriptional regulator [Sporolactobacillus sp. KGMB 08714]|uniref:LacI family DNA-binding transcriptional regulator n=1 Tax=Sporolactobacillus sp. KGMB 08714 TaxID=3064704 RepID=UPI002FBD3881
MKDVAIKANVSTATVSRVLNGNYPVSKEIMERVKQAIEDLQYKPNSIARSLRIKRSNLIAIVVTDIRNPYYISIAREIDNCLFDDGYNLIFCSTDESAEKEKKILEMLIEKNVDAVIISPCTQDPENLMPLIKENIFTVLIDRDVPFLNLNYVGEQNFNESYSLTEYLIKKGHKKIAIMNGTLDSSTGMERYMGYQSALKQYDIPLCDDLILSGGYYERQAFQTMNELFLSNNGIKPTAIVSCNNLMSEGIMRAAIKNHKRIPEDISLVSFGEIVNQEFIKTKITCIKQKENIIGENVSKIVLNKLGKNSEENLQKKISISNQLIEGNSVLSLNGENS